MNELMMVIYSNMESGGIIMKDPEGVEEWTERDVKRALRKRYVHGYDAKFKFKSVYIPLDSIMSIYVVSKDDAREELEGHGQSGKEPEDPACAAIAGMKSKPKDEVMFG